MNDKKIIREYYYVIGEKDFSTRFHLLVNKETEKMLYGVAYDDYNANYVGKFAINKDNLNKINQIRDKKYGMIYRIQILDDFNADTEKIAREMIYNYLIETAKYLMNNEQEV